MVKNSRSVEKRELQQRPPALGWRLVLKFDLPISDPTRVSIFLIRKRTCTDRTAQSFSIIPYPFILRIMDTDQVVLSDGALAVAETLKVPG